MARLLLSRVGDPTPGAASAVPDLEVDVLEVDERVELRQQIAKLGDALDQARGHYLAALGGMQDHVADLERQLDAAQAENQALKALNGPEGDEKLLAEIDAQREVIARLENAPKDAGRRELLQALATNTRLACLVEQLTEANRAADRPVR